jgi:hypothetical protein
MRSIMSIYIVLALGQMVRYMTTFLVEEKEKKLREGLLMMGLRYSVFWASWALTYAAVAVLVSAGMTAIFVGTGMLRLTSPLLIVALLASFGCSLVPLSMATSTLLSLYGSTFSRTV